MPATPCAAKCWAQSTSLFGTGGDADLASAGSAGVSDALEELAVFEEAIFADFDLVFEYDIVTDGEGLIVAFFE